MRRPGGWQRQHSRHRASPAHHASLALVSFAPRALRHQVLHHRVAGSSGMARTHHCGYHWCTGTEVARSSSLVAAWMLRARPYAFSSGEGMAAAPPGHWQNSWWAKMEPLTHRPPGPHDRRAPRDRSRRYPIRAPLLPCHACCLSRPEPVCQVNAFGRSLHGCTTGGWAGVAPPWCAYTLLWTFVRWAQPPRCPCRCLRLDAYSRLRGGVRLRRGVAGGCC